MVKVDVVATTAAAATAAIEERGQYSCKRRSYCSSTTAIVLCTVGVCTGCGEACYSWSAYNALHPRTRTQNRKEETSLNKKRRLAIFIQKYSST